MIDNELKFDKPVENLYKKACQKLHALARISKYMSSRQRRIIMKSFINFIIQLLSNCVDVS